jgi:hypothetical protein
MLGTKTYIGTKTLRAKPMIKYNFAILKGFTVDISDNPNEEGYFVEYTDAGNPNAKGFANYVGWIPKDVFERTYHEVTATDPIEEMIMLAEKNYRAVCDKKMLTNEQVEQKLEK